MVDTVDKKTRSRIMSSIRSKNTRVELVLRKALWQSGLRYRIHYNVKGKPDIVFTKKRIAIFVDGDFWHGHNWRKLRPKLKNDYWISKIKGNVRRDRRITSHLEKDGWQVIRIWEHELNLDKHTCVSKIKEALKND